MEDYRLERTVIYEPGSLLEEARNRVLAIFNERQNAQLVFHNYQLSQEVVALAETIAEEEQIPEEAIEVTQLAANFLMVGFLYDYEHPAQFSITEARKFLIQKRYPDLQLGQVLKSIQITLENKMPQHIAERILSDAFQVSTRIRNFEQRNPFLRLEYEFLLQRTFAKVEWLQLQLQSLISVRLNTHYTNTKYGPVLAQNILQHKKQLEKVMKNRELEIEEEEEAWHKFQNLEKKLPVRATQTFFRSNYRNHINLSAIADNKANIMISVNSIMISVLISILTYRNIAETNPMVLMPIVIFLVTGLASLIFAVLSARPKITALNSKKTPRQEVKKNIVFFGNFVQLDLVEYEEAMDAMFRDSELMYGNMTRDLYYLGKVLDKKYRYLIVSYNIFMVGFIATVGTFLLALFR